MVLMNIAETGLWTQWGKAKVGQITYNSAVSVAQSCPTLCPLRTAARQAPLSMGFSRQEHWSGVPFPSPGDLPDPGRHQTWAPCTAGRFFTI